jgi:hypothetical protein
MLRKQFGERQQMIDQHLSRAAQAEQQAVAMQMMISAEIRETARDLFVSLIDGHLQQKLFFEARNTDTVAADPQVDLRLVKLAADLSVRCAAYLHQAAGMIDIDDAKQWRQKDEAANGQA